MEELAGKTAVITGAASGIGLSLAHRFGAAGMNLVLADIEQPALETAASTLAAAGHDVLSREVDVRDLDQMIELEAAARERFGHVHILCNNAGVAAGGGVLDGDLDLWRWTIDINLWGVIYGCKVFLPAMVDHGEPAHVVNTASMAGLGAAPYMGAYNISKYGVVALSETMSRELQIAGAAVGVSVLCPAFVRTGIAESDRNMPAELRSRTHIEPDEGTESVVKSLVAAGMSPDAVADEVHAAVVANRFWILTHPETFDAVTGRATEIVQGANPTPGLIG